MGAAAKVIKRIASGELTGYALKKKAEAVVMASTNNGHTKPPPKG